MNNKKKTSRLHSLDFGCQLMAASFYLLSQLSWLLHFSPVVLEQHKFLSTIQYKPFSSLFSPVDFLYLDCRIANYVSSLMHGMEAGFKATKPAYFHSCILALDWHPLTKDCIVIAALCSVSRDCEAWLNKVIPNDKKMTRRGKLAAPSLWDSQKQNPTNSAILKKSSIKSAVRSRANQKEELVAMISKRPPHKGQERCSDVFAILSV